MTTDEKLDELIKLQERNNEILYNHNQGLKFLLEAISHLTAIMLDRNKYEKY
jgi:hypothetical protein